MTVNEVNNMLFALLRSVLCDECPNEEVLRDIDAEKLEKIYEVLKKHDMSHLLASAIDKCGLTVEGELATKISKAQFAAVYRYENMNYELSRVRTLFEDAGIEYIPLKGAVIRELYPESWMRTSSDVDVLVRSEDLDRAIGLLDSSLGYKRIEKDEDHDVSLFSQNGVHLELHFSLKENIAEADEILDKVWDFSLDDGRGRGGRILAPEFFVYYHTVHMLCHFLTGGCGIRTVYDLHLLRRAASFDESKVLELCRSAGIEKFYVAICELASAWFEDGEGDGVCEKLEDYVIEGGVFGTDTTHYSVKRGARGGMAGYVGRRVFVSYDYLKKKYPRMKSKAHMPIYQVRRWIDALGKGRLNDSLEELKFTSGLDDSRVDEIRLLMNELEIQKHIK